MTERQQEIYKYIIDYQSQWGFSPSIRDIGNALYISHTNVKRHLDNLERDGYIKRTPKIPRSIIVINSGGC